MLPLDREQLTAAFDADEDLHIPDLKDVHWSVLDYFGWVHPSGHLGFVVLQSPNDGQLRGIRMTREKRRAKKTKDGNVFLVPSCTQSKWDRHVHGIGKRQ